MASSTLQPTLRCEADRLIFTYPFRIAHGVRTGTDVVLVKLSVDGHFGLGEATLPPYLPWQVDDVLALLRDTQVTIDTTGQHPTWSAKHTALYQCPPACAAVDMAVWNLTASLQGQTLAELIGYPDRPCPHTFTLGISDTKEMAEKLAFAREQGFSLFKLKMDAAHSQSMFDAYRSLTDAPFAIDANQGWTPGPSTVAFAQHLAQHGCILIEQPFERTNRAAHRELCDVLDIPVIADESVQNLNDFEQLAQCYDGVNIKLQKCGGITAAIELIGAAEHMQKDLLIGCMSESSIGCSSAEALTSRAMWADLDGPWLIANDHYIQDRAFSL
jgi:L-alanine-DL-glutamate epimerase-like enolase superfamily enzyme